MLTEQELSMIAEIKQRERAATEGPWETKKERGDISVFPVFSGCSAEWQGWYSEPDIEDATFIAASRTDIPFLLSLVDRLQARVDELEAHLSPKTCHFENANERCNEGDCAYYTTFTWADCPHGGKYIKDGDAE
jgi:hypothetical protein